MKGLGFVNQRRVVWAILCVLLFGLGASAQSSPSVTLTWIASAQPQNETVASWNVYRSTVNGPYTLLASVPVASLTYQDNLVAAGSDYFYVVTAVNTANVESAYSASVEVAIPASAGGTIPVAQPLAVTTTALPAGTVGLGYSATLSAAGGNSPYTWSGSGIPGLAVSITGLLGGTPTQSGGFNETVTVTDVVGTTASTSIPVNVNAAAPPPVTPPPVQPPPVSPPPVATSLPNGLVLDWTLDTSDISNGVIADMSGNQNNGTLVGNAQFVAGKVNQALSFNGSTSYIATGSDVAGFTNSLTLAAWINTTNASRTEAIFSNFNAAGSGAGYILGTTSQGNLAVRIGGADISAYPNLVTDPTIINDGAWHHVVATISFELQTIQFYVDGKPTSTTAVSLLPNGSGGATLQVGVNPWADYGDYFTGAIEGIQVYNRALDASEVGTVYLLSGGAVQ